MLKEKYPKLYHFLYDEDKLQARFFIFGGTIFIALSTYFIISEKLEKEAYRNSKYSFGIVQDVRDTHSKGGAFHRITFSYRSPSGKTHVISDDNVGHPWLDYRKKGDTIVILFSITNNEYARIVYPYWNDKVKKLCQFGD